MSISYQLRPFILAFVMLMVIVLIMAALWFPKTERVVKVTDLLVVLDITQSMNVQDVERNGKMISRLTWAKEFTRQTLQHLQCGSHIGLAVFSEARSLILINPVEVCANYHDLSQMITKINGPMAWALSSEVSKAVFTAIEQAKLMKSQPGIMFITDGHESPPIHKTLYPQYKGTLNDIYGVFVGVGGDKLLPIPKYDLEGNKEGFWKEYDVVHQDVYTSIRGEVGDLRGALPRNEHLSSQKKSHLAQLASRIKFDYITSPSTPKSVLKMVEQKAESHDHKITYDGARWFVGIALLLLVLMYFPFKLFRKARG